MEKIFRLMGFDDTENIAGNAGCHVTAAEEAQQPRVEPQHRETVQISDAAYEAMSFAGTVWGNQLRRLEAP